MVTAPAGGGVVAAAADPDGAGAADADGAGDAGAVGLAIGPRPVPRPVPESRVNGSSALIFAKSAAAMLVRSATLPA